MAGILNKHGDLQNIKEVKKQPQSVATTFFREVLNLAIRALGLERRTRRFNAATTGSRHLLKVYRLYPEDIQALSFNIKAMLRARPRDVTFHYYFVFYKYEFLQKEVNENITSFHPPDTANSKSSNQDRCPWLLLGWTR